MSKRRKLQVVDTTQLPVICNVPSTIDWNLCILCQQKNSDPLVCPTLAGYTSLVSNLNEFSDKNALPQCISLEQMNDGSGILSTLSDKNAKYHKTCRNKYDGQKLSRLSASNYVSTDSFELCSTVSTRSSVAIFDIKSSCLFCEGGSTTGKKLLNACTKEIGPKIYSQAVQMRDSSLLAKIASTDFIALEVKYHNECYTQFRNRFRSHQRDSVNNENDPNRLTYGAVISEMIQYIEETFLYSNTAPVFKLSDLTKLVANRMTCLGVESDDKSINRTRLKEQLLSMVPGLREDKSGRDVLLTFEGDVRDAIREACEYNDLTDGMCVARAASILRRDMFKDFPKFSGSLTEGFGPRDCVPPSLVNFLSILLGGQNIDSGSPASYPEQTAAFSIAQLIRFNCVKRQRTNRPEHTRHHIHHETPLPIYLGLMLHSRTRKKSLVDKMSRLGLCVSYDRVQQIESTVTTTMCDAYNSLGHVVPPNLSKHVFTTAAIDNIDHNPSSSTASDSFHGSSVTVIQHPHVREPFPSLQLADVSWSRKITCALPESYTSVPATGDVTCEVPIKSVNSLVIPIDTDQFQLLGPWLATVESSVCDKTDNNSISFAAYHSMANVRVPTIQCNSILLPLLPDHIQSPSTIRHLMNVIINITGSVNNGQPAVITGDQPVYALAKYVQWKFPDLYGEDRIVMMMGGLHIEMAIQNMIGKWLSGSGWTDMFLKAEIATSGRCELYLKSSHVKRTRYAHEVSLASLYILRNYAYAADAASTTESFENWIARRRKESAQFLYWQTTMELESMLLNFVCSIRESNFTFFVQILREVCPWFFALDLVHYSRWLPVFLRTMDELPVRHPGVYDAFLKGHFTSRRTNSTFSAISDDHLHEQNNKLIKGDGGAIGILDNESALLKWMVSGPEVSRMVQEFELTAENKDAASNEIMHHHESTKGFQSRFIRHVSAVVESVQREGNPFAEQDLQTADSQKVLMTASAESSVVEAQKTGHQKFNSFVEDRLVFGRKSLREPIQKSNLALFTGSKKPFNSNKMKITDLRHDSNTFCKLYVASQSRAADIDDFFAHENSKYPPSISDAAKLRMAKSKSDILACLEKYLKDVPETPTYGAACALIVDGSALVHMLSPGSSKTFEDYLLNIMCPYVQKLLRTVHRLDIVFDRYLKTSLKAQTRESRGSGQRVNVTLKTLMPRNFNKFLAVDDNKEQLFNLISKYLVSTIEGDKALVCTVGDTACSNNSVVDVSSISPCNAEEADGRLLLHADNAVKNGQPDVIIRTVDSDVVIIASYAFNKVSGIQKLWIDFGVGKHRRMIPIHEISRNMPPPMTSALPFFHAFTGCDTVSTFCGIGKRTAWKAWMSYRNFELVIQALSASHVPDDDSMEIIERFVVLMYDSTSTCTTVNECRRILYTRKSRAIENIPPTADALLQHCKRAMLQAHIWMSCLSAMAPVLEPSEMGWQLTDDGSYAPIWSTIPDISSHCTELVRCSCKTVCKNCKCRRNGLRCTKLCACDGLCVDEKVDGCNSDQQAGDDESVSCDEGWQEVEEDTEADNVLDIVFDEDEF